MSNKVITLPDSVQLLARLLEANNNDHLRERFYPMLLKEAGKNLAPTGIALMLVLAISDYTEGMPPSMTAIMYMMAPDLIDALVDDLDVAVETKAILQEMLS